MKNAFLYHRVVLESILIPLKKMNKVLNCNKSKAGLKKTNKPRHWNHNTDLCVDVKTHLRNDPIAVVGKSYQGVLTHDRVEHYTFTEAAAPTTGKRNPHVFDGRHITITRRDDGSLRPNFKELPMDDDFNIYRYATGVFSELIRALRCLVGKEASK